MASRGEIEELKQMQIHIQSQLANMHEAFLEKFGKLEENNDTYKKKSVSPDNQTNQVSEATTAITGLTKVGRGGINSRGYNENQLPNADIQNLQLSSGPNLNMPIQVTAPNQINNATSKSNERALMDRPDSNKGLLDQISQVQRL